MMVSGRGISGPRLPVPPMAKTAGVYKERIRELRGDMPDFRLFLTISPAVLKWPNIPPQFSRSD